jgi:DNA (cytosine-5)-methyltransferase 1
MNSQLQKMKTKKPRVLDIFCGAGGFSEGFRQAGFEIAAGIDNDPQALETYGQNFGSKKAVLCDLSRVKTLINSDGGEQLFTNIRVIIGGPPCQGFSIAGKRKDGDPRNKLYRAYFDLIKKIRPKVVVIENVPTMRTLFDGRYFSMMTKELQECGFNVYHTVLTADKHGIPQKRKRIFVVGTRGCKKHFSFPIPSDENTTSCEDAISDLPLLENESGGDVASYVKPPKTTYQKMVRNGCKRLTNHWAVMHTEKTKNIISMVPDGGNYKFLPRNLWLTRKVNIAWTRMHSKSPCFTIDAGHNHHFHYKANRVPTVRECARIQSFPDHFIFLGNKTSQFRQVGNAVPPLLAKRIAEKVRIVLDE